MTDQNPDRDALLDVIADVPDQDDPWEDVAAITDAILASDWLAEVLRMVSETAWRQGYEVGYDDQRFRDTTKPVPPNPYRRGEDAS